MADQSLSVPGLELLVPGFLVGSDRRLGFTGIAVGASSPILAPANHGGEHCCAKQRE
jgi:hypothetical protein